MVARAGVDTGRRRLHLPHGGRRLAAGLSAIALLGAGAYATPPTRAALEDLADTFTAWVAGDSADAPGRSLAPGEQAPAYFHARHYEGDARVIAEADGYKLYAILQPDGGRVRPRQHGGRARLRSDQL